MMNNTLSTAISDALLQRLRDFLDEEADMYAGGFDPAQSYEANKALRLLRELDGETGGELLARKGNCK
jgi:hypothetical protein